MNLRLAIIPILTLAVLGPAAYWYEYVHLPQERAEFRAQFTDEEWDAREAAILKAGQQACAHVWSGKRFEMKAGIFQVKGLYHVHDVDPMTQRVRYNTHYLSRDYSIAKCSELPVEAHPASFDPPNPRWPEQ